MLRLVRISALALASSLLLLHLSGCGSSDDDDQQNPFQAYEGMYRVTKAIETQDCSAPEDQWKVAREPSEGAYARLTARTFIIAPFLCITYCKTVEECQKQTGDDTYCHDSVFDGGGGMSMWGYDDEKKMCNWTESQSSVARDGANVIVTARNVEGTFPAESANACNSARESVPDDKFECKYQKKIVLDPI